MCGLCGVLGGEGHWTDAPGAAAMSRRRERMGRVQLANTLLRHYGLNLSDWQGTSYILRSSTGRTELVDNLTSLWPTAEKLTGGRRCDPLDEALLAKLNAEG
jgi:hypothetical protein